MNIVETRQQTLAEKQKEKAAKRMLDVTICLQKPVLEPSVETAALDPAQGIQNRMSIAETPPDSEILSLLRIYSEFLSFFQFI